MTLKTHLHICLTSSVLSFFVLLLVLVVGYDAEQSMVAWLITSAMVFSVGAARAWWGPDHSSTLGEHSSATIGNSDFEKSIAIATVWTPPMLAVYGILSIFYFHATVDDVGWVLIVLSCNAGFKMASIIESI